MKLTDQEVKHKISEIISGKRLFHLKCEELNQIFIFMMPSHQHKLDADIIYDATYLRALSDDIPTRISMEEMIETQGLISDRDKARVGEYVERLKTLKLMRSRTRSVVQTKRIEKEIEKIENLQRLLHNKQQQYFMHTAEAKAEQEKTVYLIHYGILTLDNQQVWKSIEAFKKDEREMAQGILIDEYLAFARGFDTETLRYIARHKEWRIYWKACLKTGSQLFSGPTTDWDVNKLLLTYWSDFYENIFQCPEPPPDEILEDDYKCDKWIEDQLHATRTTSAPTGAGAGGSSPGMTVKHQVAEPYRVVTQTEFDKEQQEKARMES